jgi:tetratricopeptide (TPR) repeat protein
MESYKWVAAYTLHFLDATLKKDNNAMQFMDNEPSGNGAAQNLISQTTKRPEKRAYTFQDFNDLASGQNYNNLSQLYDSIVKSHPAFTIPEGNLNTLGLQLVFNPKTSSQGIKVFLLATRLFPDSANLYDSLAEGYLFMGNTDKAIESFEKSLALNPQSQNAINRLEQLKK